MTVLDAIRARHSVRTYQDRPLEGATLAALEAVVEEARQASGLNIQLVQDNPEVFEVVANFGLIHGCTCSIAFPKTKGDDAQDELIGYWGQHIVLTAQRLGLNTCWVGICARKKSKARLCAAERLRLVIAVGYGTDGGVERTTKPIERLAVIEGDQEVPEWFWTAMEAVQLAPTALNAQNFCITLMADGMSVKAEAKKSGFRQVDLGIVKYTFEVVANECGATWQWA